MTPVQSMIAVTYVRDIDSARAFYELLGFREQPLMFYFFCNDLDAVVARLGTAGVEVVRTGHPPHAPGGEVKVLDPDGNTILIGQPERSASAAPAAEDTEEAEETEAAAASEPREGGGRRRKRRRRGRGRENGDAGEVASHDQPPAHEATTESEGETFAEADAEAANGEDLPAVQRARAAPAQDRA